MAPSPLSNLLRERFEALGGGTTRLAWAKKLGVDKGTLSRILNGLMPLTAKRADDWATILFENDAGASQEFASRMLDAARAGAPAGQANVAEAKPVGGKLSVDAFCDSVIRDGGAVGAARITDLFEALVPSDTVRDPIVLIEYGDLPRAGPDAKYQSLGRPIARAVARGVNVGMLFPFKLPANAQLTGTSEAVKYMAKIYDECKRTYVRFTQLATDDPDGDAKEISKRLLMYVAGDVSETATPSFQSKLFYVQWDDEKETRHHRIFQWVSSPAEDWLVYRGDHIEPKAVRDAFFPIPHAFGIGDQGDVARILPILNERRWPALREKLEPTWPELGSKCLWYSEA